MILKDEDGRWRDEHGNLILSLSRYELVSFPPDKDKHVLKFASNPESGEREELVTLVKRMTSVSRRYEKLTHTFYWPIWVVKGADRGR